MHRLQLALILQHTIKRMLQVRRVLHPRLDHLQMCLPSGHSLCQLSRPMRCLRCPRKLECPDLDLRHLHWWKDLQRWCLRLPHHCSFRECLRSVHSVRCSQLLRLRHQDLQIMPRSLSLRHHHQQVRVLPCWFRLQQTDQQVRVRPWILLQRCHQGLC